MTATLTVCKRSPSSLLRQPPLVRGAASAVELGRIFPRPNRLRSDLRPEFDTLPAGDQNRFRAILGPLSQNRLFLHRRGGDREYSWVQY